jgi:hypothetical protein
MIVDALRPDDDHTYLQNVYKSYGDISIPAMRVNLRVLVYDEDRHCGDYDRPDDTPCIGLKSEGKIGRATNTVRARRPRDRHTTLPMMLGRAVRQSPRQGPGVEPSVLQWPWQAPGGVHLPHERTAMGALR